MLRGATISVGDVRVLRSAMSPERCFLARRPAAAFDGSLQSLNRGVETIPLSTPA
jgi:hypothetical protein